MYYMDLQGKMYPSRNSSFVAHFNLIFLFIVLIFIFIDV